MSKQYWFICYSHDPMREGGKTRFYNECINVSPMNWQVTMNTRYDEGKYVVMWAHSITRKQHDTYAIEVLR